MNEKKNIELELVAELFKNPMYIHTNPVINMYLKSATTILKIKTVSRFFLNSTNKNELFYYQLSNAEFDAFLIAIKFGKIQSKTSTFIFECKILQYICCDMDICLCE